MPPSVTSLSVFEVKKSSGKLCKDHSANIIATKVV